MSGSPLKIDLHIHTREDSGNKAPYTAFQLIDIACHKGFDAIAITNHSPLHPFDRYKAYAQERGLLLIPGIEKEINNKHVLCINMLHDKIYTLSDIRRQKQKESLVIAPHPFFPGMQSLGKRLEQYADCFDAIEYCHFYSPRFNFNQEAIRFAHKHQLPMIATSDAHILEQFGSSYSIVYGEKSISGIIHAVKTGQITCVAPPLTLAKMIIIYLKILKNKRTVQSAISRIMGIAWRMSHFREIKKHIS